MRDAPQRLKAVDVAIERAAATAGRRRDEVTLVAVSKLQDRSAIDALIAAGQRDFGESRIQEAQAKWANAGDSGLTRRDPELRLHLIGRLQSNKAKEAVALFDVLHSIDRLSVVEAVSSAMAELGRAPDCFVQVNIGDEDQKGGCTVDALPTLIEGARGKGLRIVGLMCIPPAGVEPAPYFALLANLAGRHDVTGLSMGMSGDYETAVMVGATHVRVGTALFGARDDAGQ